MTGEIIPARSGQILPAASFGGLLDRIRPEWQAKSLIDRVRRLVSVDPSSACQRLLNAAIHDLKKKIVIAGIDIACDIAKANRLPSIENEQDIENYSTDRALDLSLHMGLLTRAEWSKLKRAYSIRKDLEHEDDEYEAGPEDCVYVFMTCIEIVLSRDPVQMVRVTDFKEIIEKPEPVTLCQELLADYEKAPKPRQVEIGKFLISVALDDGQPDIVRQNAYRLMTELESCTRDQVKIELANELQGRTTRGAFTYAYVKVGHGLGVLPYVKQKRLTDYFLDLMRRLNKAGFHWKQHELHGPLLSEFEDIGGFEHCPPEVLPDHLMWCVLAFLGESGGYGRGFSRPVFYSDSAEPHIMRLVRGSAGKLRDVLKAMGEDKDVKRTMWDKHIARRFEILVDSVDQERL